MSIKKLALTATCAIVALAAATPASAVVFFTSFDSHVVDGGPPSGGAGFDILASLEGWTATSGAGIEVQNGVAGAPFSGPNLVELDSNNNSSMSRTITDAGAYSLTFYYSPRPGIPPTSNGIDVLLNGVSIFNVTGAGGGGTSWTKQQVLVNAAAGDVLTFAATGDSDSLGGYIDDARMAVPEPATWAMMIGGFGLVGAAMRRRGQMATRLA